MCDAGNWCWHCCHPIDGERIPLPIQYDERLDQFKTMGQFCSFECAKGYNRDTRHYRSGERGMLLARLKQRTTGSYSRTIPAPPRQVLHVFGGTLSLADFRRRSAEKKLVSVLPKNLVPIEHIISTHEVTDQKTVSTKRIDFKGILAKSTSQNEMLRLRRPVTSPGKKEAQHSSLEQFVRKCN